MPEEPLAVHRDDCDMGVDCDCPAGETDTREVSNRPLTFWGTFFGAGLKEDHD